MRKNKKKSKHGAGRKNAGSINYLKQRNGQKQRIVKKSVAPVNLFRSQIEELNRLKPIIQAQKIRKEKENMNINKIVKEIHENAVTHGWWDEERTFGDIVALCHSELSEALEEYRDGKPEIYYGCYDIVCKGQKCNDCEEHKNSVQSGTVDKPEGTAVELVDCVIRIFDYLGKTGVDVEQLLLEKHNYNKSRPYRHGGKTM